ncbi:MAG: class IV adenylate cyclase [Clostridia bacterium]|nr:class IV adenylate cyclase [Clostridia bacterium]
MDKNKIRTAMMEFEEKFFCVDKTKLINQLKEDGFEFVRKESEVDTYLTDSNSKFINTRTYLRIRKRNGKSLEITYKDKTKDAYSREVHHNKQATVSTGIESYEEAINLFKILGYSPYVTVYKDIEVYSMEYDGVEYNVIIDELENVGNFVEFEIISPKQYGMEDVKEIFKKFIAKYKEYELTKAPFLSREYVAKKLYDDINKGKNLRGLIFTLNENARAEDEVKRLLKLDIFKLLHEQGFKLAIVNKSKTALNEEFVWKLDKQQVFDLIITKIGNEKMNEVYDMVLTELKFVKDEVLILEEDAVTCRVDEKQNGCFESITQICLILLNGLKLKGLRYREN